MINIGYKWRVPRQKNKKEWEKLRCRLFHTNQWYRDLLIEVYSEFGGCNLAIMKYLINTTEITP